CCRSSSGQRPCRKWSAGWHEERAVTAYARTMRQVGSGTAPSEEESATFSAAVAGLRSCQDQVRQIRPELCFEEVPAPRTLAPFATAVGAAVRVDGGLAGHMAAWCGTMCAAAGLAPLAAGVSALRPASRRRSP